MNLIKLNKIVSMYKKPVIGNVKAKKRYMALSIDKSSKNPYKGIARQIIKRRGNVNTVEFVDISKLILVESKNLLKWTVIKDLEIKDIEKITKKFENKETYFIGLEDPDIWTDEKGIKHVYFTITYKYKNKIGHKLFLGHAEGNSLEKLVATDPVIADNKEIAISPIKSVDFRYILAESWTIKKQEEGISLLKAKNMSNNWEFERLVFDPKKYSYAWCAGYASPCMIINPSLMSINKILLLGICTGNSGEYSKGRKEYRGDFKPGLFLFNPKTGEIPWIDPEPLFEDPDATTITFASDFIQTSKNKGILYCHIDDSFVRAYKINFEKIRERLSNIDL